MTSQTHPTVTISFEIVLRGEEGNIMLPSLLNFNSEEM